MKTRQVTVTEAFAYMERNPMVEVANPVDGDGYRYNPVEDCHEFEIEGHWVSSGGYKGAIGADKIWTIPMEKLTNEEIKTEIEELKARLAILEDQTKKEEPKPVELKNITPRSLKDFFFVDEYGNVLENYDNGCPSDGHIHLKGNYFHSKQDAEFQSLLTEMRRPTHMVPKVGETYWRVMLTSGPLDIINEKWNNEPVHIMLFNLGLTGSSREMVELKIARYQEPLTTLPSWMKEAGK